jgi:hypothetical protein
LRAVEVEIHPFGYRVADQLGDDVLDQLAPHACVSAGLDLVEHALGLAVTPPLLTS